MPLLQHHRCLGALVLLSLLPRPASMEPVSSQWKWHRYRGNLAAFLDVLVLKNWTTTTEREGFATRLCILWFIANSLIVLWFKVIPHHNKTNKTQFDRFTVSPCQQRAASPVFNQNIKLLCNELYGCSNPWQATIRSVKRARLWITSGTAPPWTSPLTSRSADHCSGGWWCVLPLPGVWYTSVSSEASPP